MNETVNKFLLAGDKLMPKMHLKQLKFTYSLVIIYEKQRKNSNI